MLSSNDWTLLILCDALLVCPAGQFQVMLSVPPLNNLFSLSLAFPTATSSSSWPKRQEQQPHAAQGEVQEGTWRGRFSREELGAAQTHLLLARPTDRHFSLLPLSSHEIRKETRCNDSLLKCAFPADLTLGRKSVYKINF